MQVAHGECVGGHVDNEYVEMLLVVKVTGGGSKEWRMGVHTKEESNGGDSL